MKKIISDSQFGLFYTNSVCFYSRVIGIVQERDKWADCIHLNLKTAFDKVPHNKLLWKLEHGGGVGGSIRNWMSNYLMSREIRMVARDEKSEWRTS